jgi:hypothetical protein
MIVLKLLISTTNNKPSPYGGIESSFIMRFTIKSKKLECNFDFFMPDAGGYVRLESNGKSGTAAPQICLRGRMSGSTLSATPASFESVCRSWYRAAMRNV